MIHISHTKDAQHHEPLNNGDLFFFKNHVIAYFPEDLPYSSKVFDQAICTIKKFYLENKFTLISNLMIPIEEVLELQNECKLVGLAQVNLKKDPSLGNQLEKIYPKQFYALFNTLDHAIEWSKEYKGAKKLNNS